MPRLAPIALCAVLLLPGALHAFALAAPPAPTAWLEPELAELVAEDDQSVRTFALGLDAPAGETTLRALARAGFATMAYEHLPVVIVVGRAADLPRALETPGVVSAALDREVELHALDGLVLPRAEAGNVGGTGDEITRADRARALGVTGRGVGLAVLDLGTSGLHPGLRPRELGGPLVQNVKVLVSPGRQVGGALQDVQAPVTFYIENQTNSDWTDGHGTHTAGIAVGGWTEDGLLGGRAPGADLIAVGAGDMLALPWILGGLEWILAHKDAYHIRIASNSWGLQGPYQPQHPVNLATKALADADILVLFSAGNNGPGLRTMNAYAQAPHVVAVGSTTLSGGMAHSSSRGDPLSGKPGPDLVAPGVDIISGRNQWVSGNDVTYRTPWTDSAYIPPQHLHWYRAVSGTSMAAPQVAGIAALVMEADPTLSADDVREILVSTSRPLVGYERTAQGAGMVDAEAAVLAALGREVPPRDHVEPTVIVREAGAETYPFHASVVAGPEKSASAFRPRHPFPVRLPSDGVELTYTWSLYPGVVPEPAQGHMISLHSPDGTLVARRVLDTTSGAVTIEVPKAELEARRDPSWSASYWTVIVDVNVGLLAYDLEARVLYPDGLPPVSHVPPPPPPPFPPRVPHAPIRILTDADFTEANGVVSGAGTADDPYIIEGWEIIPSGSVEGIWIGDRAGVQSHVIVRNVRVADSRGDCVHLQGAPSVHVVDSHFDGCLGSFFVAGGGANRFERNVFQAMGRGPSIYGADGMVIADNKLVQMGDWGILISQGMAQFGGPTLNVRVERNELVGPDSTILLTTPLATGATVRDNAFGGGAGIFLDQATSLHRVSGSRWMDGTPNIVFRAGNAETSVESPNTIVDAGSDRSALLGEAVCFDDARATIAPTDTLVSLVWDFGDGSTSSEAATCHAFATAGAREVRLSVVVQDALGATATLDDDARVVVG